MRRAAQLDLQAQAAGGAAGAGAGGAGAAAGGAGGGSLDFLRNNQQFQALRQIVQANPQILQPMLQVRLQYADFTARCHMLTMAGYMVHF